MKSIRKLCPEQTLENLLYKYVWFIQEKGQELLETDSPNLHENKSPSSDSVVDEGSGIWYGSKGLLKNKLQFF